MSTQKISKEGKGRLIVAGNWKMNPVTEDAAREIFKPVKRHTGKISKSEVVICPPHLYLPLVSGYTLPKQLAVGVQDIFWEKEGSHTGEVSPTAAKDIGATWSIVGHSERRAIGESDEEISRKVRAGLKAGLSVILCVGEKERDPDARYLSFLEDQIRDSLSGVEGKLLSRLVIAYEPIWAIGSTDNTALTGELIRTMVIFIRRTLARMYDKKHSFSVPVLYGGSVTVKNIDDVIENGHCNGVLVGRQSLDPDSFNEIIDHAESFLNKF